MEELFEILTAHAARYPALQPQDAVKLVYQNEFGGGHLISDPVASLEYLRREYDATGRDFSLPLLEDIGNGLSRLNLAALDTEAFPLERVNEIFVRSAEMHRGDMENFLRKLDVVRRVNFAFSASELEEYLEKYIVSGCPMVSHSDAYRKAYNPAYRVVLRKLM